MTTRHIEALNGTQWQVRRRWIPHSEGRGISSRLSSKFGAKKKSKDKKGGSSFEIPDFGGADSGSEWLLVLLVVVVGSLLFIFGAPFFLIGIDLLWFVLVFLVGAISRFVLRRPWRVEATSSRGAHSWYVSGYRAAGVKRDEIVEDLRHGRQIDPDESRAVE